LALSSCWLQLLGGIDLFGADKTDSHEREKNGVHRISADLWVSGHHRKGDKCNQVTNGCQWHSRLYNKKIQIK